MRGWNRGLAGIVLGAAVGVAAPASAQTAAPRAAVWVAAGAFLPTGDVFSDAYGRPQWPLIVQGDVRIAGPVGFFAGVRRLSRDGQTIAEAPVAAEASYPLELRVTDFRFGATAAWGAGRIEVAAGAGAEYLTGEERWPTADLSSDIAAWGVLAQGSVRIPVWRHLACLGLIEYSWLRAQPAEAGLARVDLGGITLGGGVLLRF